MMSKLVYENYNVEDCVIMNMDKEEIISEIPIRDKRTVYEVENEMTDEEKIEFIKAFDPCFEDTLNGLHIILDEVENGTIKMTKYGSNFNTNSIKAWLKKGKLSNKARINMGSYRFSDPEELRCRFAHNSYKYLSGTYQVRNVINIMNDTEQLFHSLLSHLENEEIKWYKENEEKIYKKNHNRRIENSKMLRKIIDSVDVCMPYAVYSDVRVWDEIVYGTSTRSTRSGINWSASLFGNLITNSYEELMIKNNEHILSIKESQEIADMILKYGRKIAVLIDDMEDDYNEIIERIKKENEESEVE